MSYAINTKVPIERSQSEIRKILTRYGASAFATAENEDHSILIFQMMNRRIMFRLPMPKKPSDQATQASVKTYQQLCRSKWRSLVLSIKAKLESAASGITTFEDEFMAHIVLPNGRTVGSIMSRQIEQAYALNEMPPLLGHQEEKRA